MGKEEYAVTNEELMRRYIAGDESSLEELYGNNVGLIKKIAFDAAYSFGCLTYGRYENGGLTSYAEEILSDLEQEGALTLFRKVREKDYDETKAAFTTYIYPFLKGDMYRYLESNLGTLSASGSDMRKIREAQRLYNAENTVIPEIAERLGISEYAVRQHLTYNTHFSSVYDLKYPDDEDETYTDPFEIINADESVPVDRQALNRLFLSILKEEFESLSKKDRYLIGHSFGVFGMEQLSLDEIALHEMLTVDGVEKAKDKAFERLKEKVLNSDIPVWKWAVRVIREAERY